MAKAKKAKINNGARYKVQGNGKDQENEGK